MITKCITYVCYRHYMLVYCVFSKAYFLNALILSVFYAVKQQVNHRMYASVNKSVIIFKEIYVIENNNDFRCKKVYVV